MDMTKYMKSHILNAILLFVSKKHRDTAIELGSTDTCFNTWNSLLNNNGSLNIQFD